MTTVRSYVPREWNDDDRVNDYISYHYEDSEQHVPVFKILKQMYDEEKDALYCYDLEEEYKYTYGELLYEDVFYLQQLYGDYYDTYSVSSGAASDADDVSSDVDEYLTETVSEPVAQVQESKQEIGEVEASCQSKFIYL